MTEKTDSQLPAKRTVAVTAPANLLNDLRGLINEARQNVARQVNSALVMLYWQVGKRIREDILKEKRAEYGQEIVQTLSAKLIVEFGRGFEEKNLRRMVQFAEVFPDESIVAALRRQLSWAHFKSLIPITDPLKRSFYAEMCRVERWSTRTLEHKIGHLLYERTAIAKKPEKVIEDAIKSLREEDKLTTDLVFRDPYLLDFLGLKNTYAEKDVEAAILREMEAFILELGVGFAFLERQKRITVDGDDTGDVQEKATAAAVYCRHATDFTTKNSGKPWKYVIIPHNAVLANMSFRTLAVKYEHVSG